MAGKRHCRLDLPVQREVALNRTERTRGSATARRRSHPRGSACEALELQPNPTPYQHWHEASDRSVVEGRDDGVEATRDVLVADLTGELRHKIPPRRVKLADLVLAGTLVLRHLRFLVLPEARCQETVVPYADEQQVNESTQQAISRRVALRPTSRTRGQRRR